ncbi:MAG: hypothetical protein JNK72_27155 [Myxococcales bacterium]|nr:hypothetical protein [Myxococcales bacterium]
MQSTAKTLGRLMLALAPMLAACSSEGGGGGGGGTDAGPMTTDVTMNTDTGPSADRTDAGGGTDRPDVPAGSLCNGVSIEDLTMLGMRQGEVTRYSGNNNMARNSTTAGIQVPTALQGTCNFATTYQRVFRYTVRGNAALRVSTSNPGTVAGFDTTLAVLPRAICTTTVTQLFCNDDDASLPTTAMNRFTSRVNTPVIPMGTTVLIAVGGFATPAGMMASGMPQGNFELSVEEVAPLADGAACQRDLSTGSCGANATCVGPDILGTDGTCRPNGSAAGTLCRTGNQCDTGFTCDSERGFCFRNVPDGMACERFTDAWNRCGATATCVNLQPGGIFGTCRPNGSAAGTACDANNACTGMGLACQQLSAGGTLCLFAAEAGAACNTYDSRCPDGQTCVANETGTRAGTCRPNGSAAGATCATGAMCSGMGLTCNTANMLNLCQSAAMTGQVCSAFAPCPTGNICYLTRGEDRDRGVCFAPGTEGGPCQTTGAACATGLSCTQAMPTTENTGRCVRRVADGMPCTLFGTAACNTGSTCVRETPTGNMGVCRAAGTAAGTACRDMGERCNTGLTCTAMTGAGVCTRAVTAACDPRFNTTRCPMGQSCRATSLDVGACVAQTVNESEPNNGAGSTQTLSGAAGTVAGALGRLDLDCYTVAVPANGTLFARLNLQSGYCVSGNHTIDLISPTGRLLGSNTSSGAFGCPMIDGNDAGMPALFPYARGLAAGNYQICVRSAATNRPAQPAYYLDWSVTVPST